MRYILLLFGVFTLLSGVAWGQDDNAQVLYPRVQDVSAVLWPNIARPTTVQAARARITADGTTYNAVLDEQFFVQNCSVERLMQSRLLDFLLLTARTDPTGSHRLAQRYKGLLDACLTLEGRIPRTPEAMGKELPPFLQQIKEEHHRVDEVANQLPSGGDANACGLHWFRFTALTEGGRIYLCTVETLKESPAYGIPTVTYGEVDLRVVKTLLGHEEKRVQVPYNYGWAKSDYIAFWPDMSQLPKGQLLLCLYLPGGYDAVSGRIPGTAGAMSEVIPVTGQDDPQVKVMQVFCDLYLEADPGVLKTKLQAALTQWHNLPLREFAFQMLRIYAREGHQSDAVALAYANLTDPKANTIPSSDLWHDLSLLDSLGNTGRTDMQRQVLHMLGLLAQSPVAEIAKNAIGRFRTMAAWSKEAKPAIFTNEERVTLEKTIRQRLAGDLTEDQRKNFTDFLQWLEGR